MYLIDVGYYYTFGCLISKFIIHDDTHLNIRNVMSNDEEGKVLLDGVGDLVGDILKVTLSDACLLGRHQTLISALQEFCSGN